MVQHVPAADRVAVHHGHHGLGDLADLLVHVQDVQARHTIGADVATAPFHVLVTAAAEGLVAFAGQHDHADALVLAGQLHGVDHLLGGLRAEGVVHLRAVDRDLADPLEVLVADVGVFLDGGPGAGAHGFLRWGGKFPARTSSRYASRSFLK
jgi:hypothetical protein